MSNELQEEILTNGISMPKVGMGTYNLNGDLKELLEQAYRAGYRLFDTAAVYGNESCLGRVLTDWATGGNPFFVTTKLWNQDQGFSQTLQAFHRSRSRLNLKVIDLYLMHWPVPGLRLETWRAMESLYMDG